MQSCDSKIQQLLDEKPDYKQAVANLKSDCFSIENPAANIPVDIEQSIEKACADADRPFVEIVEDHQTVRRPNDYKPRKPPGNRPLRRVVTLTDFLHRHLVLGPEATAGYGSYKAHANLSKMREKLKNKPESLDSISFRGTTGRPEGPTWWTFPEAGRETPTDAATYMEELMLDPQDIDNARREGGVIISIPAQILAGRTYKPCALDAFRENTPFRPDHSERLHGMTRPTRPGLQGHPELISRSVRYTEWQSQLEKIDLEWLEKTSP